MGVETLYTTGTVVTSGFLNDQQELQSAQALGVKMIATSTTVITVNPSVDGSSTGQTSLNIVPTASPTSAMPVYITSPVTCNFGSAAAGTYIVYAVASGSTFTLQKVISGGTAPTNSRKIGEVDFNGTAITAVRNMVDSVSGHGWIHQAGGGAGTDSLPTAAAVSINGSSTNTEGTGINYARADHTHQIGTLVAANIGDGTITGGTAGAGVKIAANTITIANINPSVWPLVSGIGTYSTMTASTPQTGFLWLATDVAGGTLYRYNGSTWAAAAPGVASSAPPSGAAGGVLSGTYPNPGLAAGVAATNVGTLGGDLNGSTLPNPTIKASVALTGTPTVPTAAFGTSSTQIASTAFVLANTLALNTAGARTVYVGTTTITVNPGAAGATTGPYSFTATLPSNPAMFTAGIVPGATYAANLIPSGATWAGGSIGQITITNYSGTLLGPGTVNIGWMAII